MLSESPASTSVLEDIAFLKLTRDRVTVRGFRVGDIGLGTGDEVRTFGMTSNYPYGCWAFATVAGQLPSGWIQLNQPNSADTPISHGFSGSPVFPENDLDVAGMLVACHDRPAHSADFLPSAYMIPWQPLQHILERAGIPIVTDVPVAGRIVLEFTPRSDQTTFFPRVLR